MGFWQAIEFFFRAAFGAAAHHASSVWASLDRQIYLNFIKDNRYTYIVDGLGATLLITVLALCIGVVIGTLIALVKVASLSNRSLPMRVLEKVANLYLTVIRGTPMVVQLFIMYYFILSPFPGIDRITAAVIAFGINSGAYVAELIRSGILSVDKGQTEAGRSLGLTNRQTMVSIIFPQALKNILPAIGNETIALLKETSVAGFIGVVDLAKAGDIIRSQTYQPFFPLISIAIVYLVIVIALTSLLTRFERRLRKSDIR